MNQIIYSNVWNKLILPKDINLDPRVALLKDEETIMFKRSAFVNISAMVNLSNNLLCTARLAIFANGQRITEYAVAGKFITPLLKYILQEGDELSFHLCHNLGYPIGAQVLNISIDMPYIDYPYTETVIEKKEPKPKPLVDKENLNRAIDL